MKKPPGDLSRRSFLQFAVRSADAVDSLGQTGNSAGSVALLDNALCLSLVNNRSRVHQRFLGRLFVTGLHGSAKTLVEIKEKLESGRAFAILPDLRVPQPDVEVNFLGGKANVSHAGAMFAVKCGAPIVVAVMRRENGKHVFDHVGTLRPDPAAADKKVEAARLTREAMKLLDERIKAHPEHWYWYNKRWLLQPVDAK